jgi:predicted dehydrogenase
MTRIGILGCGVISGIYIENAAKLEGIELAAVADVNPAAARYRADQYGVERALSPDELFAAPDIDIVINLTPNRLHAQISTQILEAGKHVYSEKPLTVYTDEARALLARADQLGRRVGNAPDTFFGGAWQTARRAIDEGLIGEPFGAMANLHPYQSPSAEAVAPRPSSPTRTAAPGHVQFFASEAFKYGVTVIFDMGPYYFNNLINLFGPVRSVVGATKKVREEAMRMGSTMKVEAPTHVLGILEFGNGALCQYVSSSDIHPTKVPHIEIYGTEGSLRLPDPNFFLGPVLLKTGASADFVEVECKHAYNQDSRGVGVADMAAAIRSGRPHRANGEMGAHVVEIINALHESAEQGRRLELTTTCARPAALPADLPNWSIDP